MFNRRQLKIQKIVRERNIEQLVHFTHINNLNSILSRGLISRQRLEIESQIFCYNDELRLDNHRHAICLSISFPNYKMFFKYRNKFGFDIKSDWVVLILSPSILWHIDCKFYSYNAASNNARKSEKSLNRKQPEALEQMFSQSINVERSILHIPESYPTDPQAEVLVLDSIPLNYIQSVDFYDHCTVEKWRNQNSICVAEHVKFLYSTRFFTKRQDDEIRRDLSNPRPLIPNFADIPFIG